MWRHGDVLIAQVEEIPAEAELLPGVVLARGEATGHAHRVAEGGTAEIWRHGADTFLQVVASCAQIVHEEHKPITLPQGTYRFWFQREYSPKEIRRIVD